MMPDASAWEAAAGVGAVIIFISTVAYALRRLGLAARPAPSVPATAPGSDAVAADDRQALERIEQRLEGLEMRVGALPSGEDITAIRVEIARLQERLRTHAQVDRSLGRSIDDVKETVNSTNAALIRLDSWLREKS